LRRLSSIRLSAAKPYEWCSPSWRNTVAENAAPVLCGEFRWRGYDWLVVYWADEADFDVVRADVPYTWRGKEADERDGI